MSAAAAHPEGTDEALVDRSPHAFVILSAMIVLAGIATWFIPAGHGAAVRPARRGPAGRCPRLPDGRRRENIFAPQGLLLAALAMGRVSYVTWVRWVWPIILVQWLLGGIFVTVAHVFLWN